MSAAYAPNLPDKEVVQLRIMDEHVTLTRWTSYDFSIDYLQPAAEFHFTIADGDLPDAERRALVVGARVRLSINDIPLCDGHIDTVEVRADRSSGTHWQITGRERIGLAVDAIADPTQIFKESQTLAEILVTLYKPFGWVAADHFSISNRASREVTKGLRGTPMTKGGKRKGPRPLKSFVLHQCKPHNHEGVHAFARRMTERHGLHIRCSEDGERLVVDTPDFTQDPTYEIRRSSDGTTNVLDGAVKIDFKDQPACIIADGYSGGGEFREHSRLKAFCVNPYFGTDADGNVLPEVAAVLLKHPTAEQVVIKTEPFQRRTVNVPPRIVFIHDEESKKPSELKNFVRRQMSLYMRKSMTAHYTVEGHGQLVNGVFVPWMVDAVVDVRDAVANINERMWVNDVRYHKSRRGGTETTIQLLRLNSLQFGEQEEIASAQTGKGNAKPVLNDDEFLRGLRLARGLSGPLPKSANGSLIRNTINRNPGDRVVDLASVRNLIHPNLKP